MQDIVTTHPFLWPFLFGAGIYGVRYLILAALAFLIATPAAGRGIGKPHDERPRDFNAALNVRRELAYSIISVIIFGIINAALFGFGWIKYSLMYFRLDMFPAWWFWASVAAMLLVHDTLFYWLHRVMHIRALYRVMHKVHHQSIYPTGFAAYSFHPTEAFAEALIVTIISYVVPAHPLAFFVFETVSTAYNVYGHCGREFYPRGTASHWLGRWINTSTAHASHHFTGRDNYGLYFMFWDRAMKTISAVKPGP